MIHNQETLYECIHDMFNIPTCKSIKAIKVVSKHPIFFSKCIQVDLKIEIPSVISTHKGQLKLLKTRVAWASNFLFTKVVTKSYFEVTMGAPIIKEKLTKFSV